MALCQETVRSTSTGNYPVPISIGAVGLYIHVATVVEQYAEHVRENSRCTS